MIFGASVAWSSVVTISHQDSLYSRQSAKSKYAGPALPVHRMQMIKTRTICLVPPPFMSDQSHGCSKHPSSDILISMHPGLQAASLARVSNALKLSGPRLIWSHYLQSPPPAQVQCHMWCDNWTMVCTWEPSPSNHSRAQGLLTNERGDIVRRQGTWGQLRWIISHIVTWHKGTGDQDDNLHGTGV